MRTLSLVTVAVAVSLAMPAAAQNRGERRREKAERPAERPNERPAMERKERPHDPTVNRRQRRQASRMCRGVHKGSLTEAEAKGLIQDEKDFASLEQQLRGDGDLTASERQQLHGELNDLSHSIYDEKHDSEGVVAPKPKGVASRREAAEAARKAHRVVAIRGQLNDGIDDATRVRLQAEHDFLVDALYDADES